MFTSQVARESRRRIIVRPPRGTTSHDLDVSLLPPPSTHRSVSRYATSLQSLRAKAWLRFRSHWTPRKLVSLAVLFLALAGLCFLQIHVEIKFYRRSWVRDAVLRTSPLHGCFAERRISSSYNASARMWGPRHGALASGLAMSSGLDCYDFAGTVRQPSLLPRQRRVENVHRTRFHSYWRVDLVPFGTRQVAMLQSFFATQHLPESHLTLWTNGPELARHPLLRPYLEQFPYSFSVDVVDLSVLIEGTALDPRLAALQDERAWVDGDIIRLLLLWNFGGVWVDMDSLLTRDLTPLLGHEFVTQWDCYDKIYQPLNGALMHFHQHSPYLCEMFYIMSHSPLPRAGTTDWGSTLYFRLWRRLLQARIPPFSVLPFCFSDGRSCRLDNRLPDPFESDRPDGKWTMGFGMEEGGGLDKALGKVFSVHLHNQWDKRFPKDGWVERLLLRRYEERLKNASDDSSTGLFEGMR